MRERYRTYFIKRKKLMRTTTFSVVLLTAATLILSSAVSATIMISGNATTMNVNNVVNKRNELDIAVLKTPVVTDAKIIRSTGIGRLEADDYLGYSNGIYANSVGSNVGTMINAIRLTPTELAGYDEWEITSVQFWHYNDSDDGYNFSHDGTIIIYDEGTSSAPGSILSTGAFTGASGDGLVEFTLSTPVTIDETKELWVGVDIPHPTSPQHHPQGLSSGGVTGKSWWWSSDGGTTWTDMTAYYAYDAMIWAGVEEPAVLDHDVKLVSINSPVSGPAGVITPEVTVENKGNYSETDVPVNMKISKILPPTTVLSEGFEDAIPGYLIFPPPGWSIQNTSTETWYKYSTGYARCSEDNYGAQDEWLITETFNCSALTVVETSMYFYMATPNDDYVEILGSTDNGATWPHMIVNITGYMASGIRSYDITSWAAGQSQVKIAWRWVSSAELTGSDYFYFRQFKIGSPYYVVQGVYEHFDGPWGPYGDNPPAGWTILDFGDETVPTWNNNDWHNYYYSTFGSNCARVYYSPTENQDEHLITPTVDCSLITGATLRFRQYYNYLSTGYAAIEGSTDNGTTWTHEIANYTEDQTTNYYIYDISSWADGESQVKIRFRYVDYNGWYWYVDDVMVGDIADEIVLFENYWFIDWVPTDWGPNGWMEEEVTGTTDYDPNVWRAANDTYSTSPTNVDPYAGNYMAIYDTGLLSPDGASCRLYTPAMDWSAYSATVLRLKFMIYISDYGSTYTDHCDVQVSTDGSTWTTLESINTYDAADPGWTEKVIDLTPYASETAAHLGFLGVDGGYRDIIIDEVSIIASITTLEYNETEYVDLDVGESKDVTFTPDWTPDDWLVSGNVDIDYTVSACTMLPGDEKPDNDCKSTLITLSYPYLHDIELTSINSPVDDGPAQTLPVEVTIKNVGQFPECCYKTNVKIGAVVESVTMFEDFESSNGGYTVTGNLWEWGTPTDPDGPTSAYSGSYCWGTDLDSEYGTYENAKLDSTQFTVPSMGKLRFWHWYDTELRYDGGNVKISTDGGSTWALLGSYLDPYNEDEIASTNSGIPGEPGFSGHDQGYWEPVEFDLSAYAGQQVMLRWHFGSDGSVQYPGWFIDDVTIIEVSLDTEYDEDICTIELDPGQSADLIFPDWTPEDLQYGVSGPITYRVKAIALDYEDVNPANDQATEEFTLNYFHDVGVKEITSPSAPLRGKTFYAVDCDDDNFVWFDSENPGVYNVIAPTGLVNFPQGACFVGDTWWICDTTGEIYTVDTASGVKTYVGNAGTGELSGLAYDPSSKILYGSSVTDLYTINMDTGAATLVGPFNALDWMISIACDRSGNMYGIDLELSNAPFYSIDTSTGAATRIGYLGVALNWGQDMAYDIDDDILYLCAVRYSADVGYPEFYTIDTTSGVATYIGDLYASHQTTCFAIPYTEVARIDVYIAPGTQSIAAIVENIGVFPESDLTVNAKLYEFITDPENGTLIYEDNVTGINLDVGEEEPVTFNSFNFVDEGVYLLVINISLSTDNYPNNNVEELGIGVDDTDPVSTHTLDPENPDGLNGWYVSDVTVTLDATDPESNRVSSGVKEIKYQINDGTVQTIPGAHGSFKLEDDGDDIEVEYWAIDNVDNEESPHNTFTVDIDQTVPEVDAAFITYEEGDKWYVKFIINATDAMSGMHRVEMYLNEGFHEENISSGPTYEFVIQWSSAFKTVMFKFVAYDIAGLSNYDEIFGGDIPISKPKNVDSQSQSTSQQTVTIQLRSV